MSFRIYKGSAGKNTCSSGQCGNQYGGRRFGFVLSQALDIAETEESLNEINLTQTFDVCEVDSEDVP